MGRLARKEGTIKTITFLLLVWLLVACTPIISTTSLIHSIAKGDAIGTATGLFGQFTRDKEPEQGPVKPLDKKSRAEMLEDLRKALEKIES